MKYVEQNHNQKLAEAGQQIDTRFAFGYIDGDNVTNATPFVKCRDFFGDVLFALETKQQQGIYGFSFDPQIHKINEDSTNILIKFVSEESKNAFVQNFTTYIPELETLTSDLKYGTIVDINEPLVLLVQADKLWQETVINISWFTYVLKCFSYPTLKQIKSFFLSVKKLRYTYKEWDDTMTTRKVNEVLYLENAWEHLKKYLKYVKPMTLAKKNVSGYDAPYINTVHNTSGFSSLLNNMFNNNFFCNYLKEQP